MTLQEAIGKVEIVVATIDERAYSFELDAMKLLIQAGKRILDCRATPFHCMVELLPGETSDSSIIDPQHDEDVTKTLQRETEE